jgi:hypothetical protein
MMATVQRKVDIVFVPGARKGARTDALYQAWHEVNIDAIADAPRVHANGGSFTVTFANENEIEPLRRRAERTARHYAPCDVIIRGGAQ